MLAPSFIRGKDMHLSPRKQMQCMALAPATLVQGVSLRAQSSFQSCIGILVFLDHLLNVGLIVSCMLAASGSLGQLTGRDKASVIRLGNKCRFVHWLRGLYVPPLN